MFFQVFNDDDIMQYYDAAWKLLYFVPLGSICRSNVNV